jgi:hypothetical protein
MREVCIERVWKLHGCEPWRALTCGSARAWTHVLLPRSTHTRSHRGRGPLCPCRMHARGRWAAWLFQQGHLARAPPAAAGCCSALWNV